MTMWIVVGIGDVGDAMCILMYEFSLFGIDEWCGNMSVNRFGLLVLQSC